ncbi:hypothetical protein MMC20_002400 [Loxospora ochrophaea]|nr:hypothetical protein [Loxospora ochrophaea]
MATVLLGSLAFNAYFLLSPSSVSVLGVSSSKTLYAQLMRNVPIRWTHHSVWNSDNRTEEDSAWNDPPGFQVREAIVALPDSFTRSVGLPSAQRWPWDESKGVYFLEGLHNLHCVKYLRKALLELHEGRPLSISVRHLKHCLDGLRQFVMCNADDTPRYTGRLHDQAAEKEPFGGVGQPRMCRDWEKFMNWATENSACFRWVPDDTPGFTEKDRYKSCPDGSVFWN